jgi:hypothetical protein
MTSAVNEYVVREALYDERVLEGFQWLPEDLQEELKGA